MATDAQIRLMMTAQPFRPFLVKLVDGRQFEVRHSENISCSTNGRDVVVHDDAGIHILEQLLVIELVPVERPASAKRKGGGK